MDTSNFALAGSNVKCQFEIPDDLRRVEVDEGQISQVMNNLVINASEAMPAGGVIKIKAENALDKPEDTLQLAGDSFIRIVISDKGIGIPHDFLSRIFEPYFSTKKKGSGLGLATSYSIIKSHGGSIRVESEIGKGTTFIIYLPASRRASPVKKIKQHDIPVVGKGRILVVDDEEVIRMLLRRVLIDAGYKVETVSDGAEAIELYTVAMDTGNPFSAVIMDLTIPGGMGGKEAVGKILQIDPGAKVIASSGYSTDSILADYGKYGFSAVATKPYTLGELEATLQQTLQS
ncbi:MAG: response regulator [Chloroflexi bacterium]|nr:response regulator [Chloroflexota bacterium]MBT7081183.1 response regulator [Chloroflexota bacterium]MBT7290849.1 response regulator [Chloroflexota bacterium]